MISKILLKIDIIGQSLIVAGMILYLTFQPAAFFIVIMLALFFLGFWQFCNGLIQAITFQNKKRIKYLLISIGYFIGLGIFTMINDGFIRQMNSRFMEFFVGIYFFGGCLALASWYYYQTYQDLSNNEHPRTFWDYEF